MNNNEYKNCPYCGEEIKAIAIKCKHCQSILDKESLEGAKKAYKKDLSNSIEKKEIVHSNQGNHKDNIIDKESKAISTSYKSLVIGLDSVNHTIKIPMKQVEYGAQLGYIICAEHGKQIVKIDIESIMVYHATYDGKTARCPKCNNRYQFFRD